MRVAAVGAALVLVSCSVPSPGTAPVVTTVPGPTTGVTAGPETGDLVGFDVAEITVGTAPLLVAVADDPLLRSSGFIGVDDIGDLDGVLFTWGGEVVEPSFHMRGVPIPLDLAFFGADAALLEVVAMSVCVAEPCTYEAPGPFAYALETPAGTVSFDPGARLVFR